MKTLLVLLTTVSLTASTAGYCLYGCTCYSDSICQYYCKANQCQYAISIGRNCSGYNTHPRECVSYGYCDTITHICQYKKSNGDYCSVNYMCSSGYCSLGTNKCQASTAWYPYVIWPTIVGLILLISVVVVLFVRRRRRLLIRYQMQCQSQRQNQYVTVSQNGSYSYQNPRFVGEKPPPPYSSSGFTPTSNQTHYPVY